MNRDDILQHTDEIAREVAHLYTGRPLAELRAWVCMAHRREAMVTELYDVAQFDRRLGALAGTGAGRAVHAAVTSIWAHEESHTRYLGSLRSLSEGLAQLAEVQGKLEGKITRSAVADGGWLARLMISAGGTLGQVPAFARDLQRLNLRDLLRFQGTLEITARSGYERMGELAKQLRDSEELARDFGYAFGFDIRRIRCEEQFHQEAFEAMAGWVDGQGEGFREHSSQECAEILYDLCRRNLSTEAVYGRSIILGPKGDEHDLRMVSDGGLGGLFAQHGLAITVVKSTLAPPFPGQRRVHD